MGASAPNPLFLLKKKFFEHPFIQRIAQFLTPCGQFGEIKQWIQDNCTDVPIPSRRELTGNVQVDHRNLEGPANVVIDDGTIIHSHVSILGNTIIGKEDDLHQIIGSLEVNDLKYIITDYQRNSILTDVIDTEVTTIQRGFGLLESIPILSLNTNDFNGKDIAGKPLFQAGTNLKTAGRPIPGIAVQIVDPSNWTKLLNSNEVGAILVKGAQIAQHLTIKSAEWINGWFNTNMSGYLDENGFMHIVKASDETK